MRRALYTSALRLKGYPLLQLQREFAERQYWPREAIREYQLKRARALLERVTASSEFYSKRLNPRALESAGLAGIPTLGKTALRGQLWREAGRGLLRGDIVKVTGGSTGRPVRVIKDRVGIARELAAAWRGYGWHGVQLGDRQARLWRMPTQTRQKISASLLDWLSNRVRFTTLDVTPARLSEYAITLSRMQPDYIYGYASMLVDLSRHMLDHGIRLRTLPMVTISTAEAMPADGRLVVQDALGAPVRCEYGCGEVGVIAMECEAGNLHVNADNVLVEVLADDGTISDTGRGMLLVTDLWNERMPLIRYELGDIVSLSDQSCDCGRGLPLLDNVMGRSYDVLRTSDGRAFYGSFVTSFFAELERGNLPVGAFQVEQVEERRVVVRIVADPVQRSAIQRRVEDYFRSDFDPKVRIQMEWPDRINRAASGKVRVVIGMDRVTNAPVK